MLHHQVEREALGAVHHHLAHAGAGLEQLLHPQGLRFIAEFPHPQGDPIPSQGGLEHLGRAGGDHLAAIDDRQLIGQGIHFF